MTKKLMMAFVAVMALAARMALAESEVVNDVTWYYSTYQEYVNGQYRYYAQITSGADKYAGDLTVPDTLGGYQVRRIGVSAFSAIPDDRPQTMRGLSFRVLQPNRQTT